MSYTFSHSAVHDSPASSDHQILFTPAPSRVIRETRSHRDAREGASAMRGIMAGLLLAAAGWGAIALLVVGYLSLVR